MTNGELTGRRRELIDFDRAEIISGSVGPILRVTGTTPTLTVTRLEPDVQLDDPGSEPPDYWRIEVVAYRGSAEPEVVTPFDMTLDLADCTGKKGIEVVGATRSERIDT